MKIINEKENPLFARKEIIVKIEKNISPNHQEVRKSISEKYSTNTNQVKIKKISAKFGSKDFIIRAFVYKSEAGKREIENKKKKDSGSEKKEVKVEVKK